MLQAHGGSAVDASQGWFPTLARSLALLSRLYRPISRDVFEELSHELVSTCVHSLVAAKAQIEVEKVYI